MDDNLVTREQIRDLIKRENLQVRDLFDEESLKSLLAEAEAKGYASGVFSKQWEENKRGEKKKDDRDPYLTPGLNPLIKVD